MNPKDLPIPGKNQFKSQIRIGSATNNIDNYTTHYRDNFFKKNDDKVKHKQTKFVVFLIKIKVNYFFLLLNY
jgi:hypothetical protein